MSHQTKRPFDSVECSTPHDLLIRCSLSNLQFPAIALTWCGLTSHRHRSIEPFFMSLAARDSEFRRWSGRVDRRICQTFAASPAEPGELPLGFSGTGTVRISGRIEGELHAATILIDDGVQVEGDIVAAELIIGGRVNGTIHANRVKLNGSAIVEGDIFHRSLSIDENARFEGTSRREETVIDVPQIPFNRPEAQADVDTIAAMEGNQKHNGPLENKWRANE
jgi:cytoskeletal protein CcmA (bactofilin family)